MKCPLHLISRLFPYPNNQNTVPIFQLGSGFQLQFDDLYGNEADYYEIIHCDYNWNHSEIPKKEYFGFWQPTNSELQQLFQHLTNLLPLHIIYSKSVYAKLLISGNYILKILNDSKEACFLLHENLATVQIQVKRARTVSNLETKHNLEFSIKSSTINFQNLKMWKRYSSNKTENLMFY
jgi:hypothetical protein